jgi:glycosyltransferase involved in cell wall biosynthesis
MDALGPWRFDILGEGDARPSLLALRDELKLTDRVHFSDGFVPTETLPRQLRGAALGLVPSRLRPDTAVMLPTKLVEYAHLGIPVVATATETVLHCFNREQIQLVSDENPSLWAEAILDLRRDSGKRRRRAEAARAFSRENRWDHHLEVYLQLIQQLTG